MFVHPYSISAIEKIGKLVSKEANDFITNIMEQKFAFTMVGVDYDTDDNGEIIATTECKFIVYRKQGALVNLSVCIKTEENKTTTYTLALNNGYSVQISNQAHSHKSIIKNMLAWLNCRVLPKTAELNELVVDFDAQNKCNISNHEFATAEYERLVHKQTQLNQSRKGMTFEQSNDLYQMVILPMNDEIADAKENMDFYAKRKVNEDVKCKLFGEIFTHEPKEFLDALLKLPKGYVQKFKTYIQMISDDLNENDLLDNTEYNKIQTKVFNKTASASTKFHHYKFLFENDPIIKELLHLAIMNGVIDEKDIPVVPSKRRLAEIKSTLLKWHRENDANAKSIYEQVNNEKPDADQETHKTAIVTELVKDRNGKVRKRGNKGLIDSFTDGSVWNNPINIPSTIKPITQEQPQKTEQPKTEQPKTKPNTSLNDIFSTLGIKW